MRKTFFLLFLLLSIAHVCHAGRSLDEIKRSGKLYVAFTSDDLKNINYPLAREFARYLNVELVEVIIEWEEVFMRDGIIPEGYDTDPGVIYTPDALEKADIICSTFTILEWRKKLFGFAETLNSAEILLIGQHQEQPADFNALKGRRIAFQQATTFENNLKEINGNIGGGIELVPVETGQEVRQKILNGEVYGIVLDADEALNFSALHDNRFKIAFPISEITKTAWAVEKNNPLIQEVENFFETITSNEVLDEIFYERFRIRYSTFLDRISEHQRYEALNRDLDEIVASGKLVVALRDRNFIYRPDGEKQFMHALAEEFADYLGVSLEMVVTPYFGKYWENGDGRIVRDSAYTPDWFRHFDVACEVFAPLDWRVNKITMIPVYPSEYTVIARKDREINSISDLRGLKGVTGRETVYEDILKENDISNFYYDVVNNFLPEIQAGNADYTILYNAFYELSGYPALEPKLSLGSLDVCWGIRDDQPGLKKKLEEFIEKSRTNGLIRVLLKAMRGNTLQTPDAFINSYYESFQTGQLPYVNYGADDGLPQEDIFSVFQDRKGYLWFGTNSGAVRYNGREMVIFDEDIGLPSSSVRDIVQDTLGDLYFATSNGISLVRKDSAEETYYQGIPFRKIFVDRDNNKWLLAENGIYRLDASGDLTDINGQFPELPVDVYDVSEDGTRIFLASSEGLFMLEQETGQIRRLSRQDCFSVYVDLNDSIWISTTSGLYISHIETMMDGWQEHPEFNMNRRLDFPVEIYTDIQSSPFGSVWLISDSRLYQVISTDQKPIMYEQEIGIKNNKILSFLLDREDNIWIGFSGGLQRLTNRKGLRNFYPEKINSYIHSVFEDRYGRIWITSNDGIFYFDEQLHAFDPGRGINNKKYLATLLDNGNILLANNFGLYELNITTLQIERQSIFPQLSMGLENIFISTRGEIFLLTGINGVIYYFKNFYSQPVPIKNRYTSNIFQLTEYAGHIIGGNSSGIVEFNGREFELLVPTDCNVWSFHAEDAVLWVGTDCGLGRISGSQFEQLEMLTYEKELVIKSISSAKNRNYLWIGTNRGFIYYHTRDREAEFRIDTKDGLSGNEITSNGLFLDSSDLLWVGTYHGISNFNLRAKAIRNYAPVCYIESIELNGKPADIKSGSVFRHNENNFVFEISALSFTDEASVEYEFYLRGASNNYSNYHRGNEYRAYYNNLPPGDYEFIYKAKGKNNIWGYADSFRFTIRKAWYNTWIFRGGVVVVLFVLVYSFYLIRLRSIKAQKEKLEQLVRERTHELEEANAEIEAQRDMAREQRDQISVQKKAITDSIQYARRIQRSMLPSEKVLKLLLPEHFIIFKPRDIVSGDFYWAARKNQSVYFTAADCTGHGVPGAFMSMLGIAFLNEIINKFDDIEPDEMLDQVRKYLIKALHQKGLSGETKDGMDMVLCKYTPGEKLLKFACANNPLYLLRDGELVVTRGDMMPVAIHDQMNPFTLHTLALKDNDRIYIFSDGFADQFGGPDMKKLLYKRFREMILASGGLPVKEQGEHLSDAFDAWKGEVEQIDDVVVIGMKF